MAIKNETRILKTNTFEEWRQKDNEISLHVGDVHDFNSLIADKEFSTTGSAGAYAFTGTRFEFSNENVLDNPNGYIILKNNPAIPSSYVVNATVSQTGGFTATIVGVLGTKKIAVKNASGTFNASQKITVGSDDITAANVSRVVSESYPKAVIKVYKNGTEQSQSITAQGFHVVNWQFTITLTGSPALPATFTEGATLYQGADLANATWQGTMYDITSTTIRSKTNTGSFNAGEILKVNGNTGVSHQIAHAKISAGNAVPYSYGQLIELHTAVSAGDVIKIDASNSVDAINELQVDIGDVTVINNATGYSAASVVTGITEIQGDIGDITGLGTTVQSTLVGSINEIETAVRGVASNYTLGTTATNLVSAINEIEGVFDASTHEISAGSTAFNITSGEFTIDSSADIILDADGGDVRLKDAGVQYGALTNDAGQLIIYNAGSQMLRGNGGANALFQGTLDVDGNFEVGASKFNVTASSGNTQIDGTLEVDGTLGVDGNFRVGSDKFNVTASNGNTQVDGTLNVDDYTTLNGTQIAGDLDLNGNADVSGNMVIHGTTELNSTLGVDGNFRVGSDKFNVTASSGNTQIDGNTTIDGYLNVGQLSSKFSAANRNNVKNALNELHDEIGLAVMTGSGTAAAGLTNLTAAVNSIDAEIGTVAAYESGTYGSTTISGVLTSLQTGVIGNDSDISALQTKVEVGQALTTTATTLSDAINELEADLFNAEGGDKRTLASLTTSDKTSIVDAINELETNINSNDADILDLQTTYLDLNNTGTQTTAGNITFGGSKTIKVNSGSTLDIDGTLIVGGAGGGSLSYATAFITIAGAANLEGLEIDRSAITGTTILTNEDAKLQWRESKVAAGGSNASHRAWQLKGFSNAATPLANTSDIVTFYNAKDLLKNQSASSGSTEVYGAWTATTDSEGFNLHLNNSGVSANTYGTTSAIPVLTVDAKGRITSATTVSIATNLTIAGDTGTSNTVELLSEVFKIEGGTNISTVAGTNKVTANLNDNVDLAGTLDVTGVGTFDSNVLVKGTLSTQGHVFLGNGTEDDTNVAGDLIVAGDLSVAGTFTTTTTADVAITDKNIKLGKGSTSSATNAGTGITFGDYAGAATFNYSHSGTKLVANKVLQATSFIGNLSGSATSLATARTIAMTGDVAWTSGSFDGTGAVTGTSTIGADKVIESHLKASNTAANGDVLAYNSSTEGFSWTTIGAGTVIGLSGNPRSGTVTLAAGANVTITESPTGTFTWVGQNDNTQYTAGRKLTLDGTRFDHDEVGTAGTTGETGTADGTYVKSITVDSTGHVTATSQDDFDSRYVRSFQVEDGDGTEVTISQGKEWKFVEGNEIDINWTNTSSGTDLSPYDLTFNHKDVSRSDSSSSANPGYGQTFTAIGSVTTNGRGHVIGVDTKTITIPAADNTNTQNTYSVSAVDGDNVDEEKIRLTGAGHNGATTDDVVIEAGTGLTIARNGDKITLTNSAPDVNHNTNTNQLTVFQVENDASADQFSVGHNDGLEFAGGGATSVAFDSAEKKVTFSSTNTEYSVGDGGLTKNNFTDADHDKLNGISAGSNYGFNAAYGYNSNIGSGFSFASGASAASGNLYFQSGSGIVLGEVSNFGGTGKDAMTISHSDTSSQASVDNTGRTYIQDITLDTFGHITGITSATETVTNTDTNTTYTAGTGLTLVGTEFRNTVTDTNTTYAGGTGISLSGTTFNIDTAQAGNIFSWGASGAAYHSMNTSQSSIYFSSSEEFRFTSGGDFHADGDITAFSTTISSDRKLKENIKVVDGALAKVCALEGVTFDWKKDGKASAGVIAQDVEKVLPSAVKEVESLGDEDTHKVVDYNQMTALFIEAIKELKEENNQLRTMVENLKDINS